eukprot:CAMPEP_0119412328 /NCGR_PEP_ID=MMETSP1335-20130426/4809_1 /TAXON_ID=259385 /ORGANISM="Chrysoculter rhomboideus, Strain RCC1486" /LENGTH=271 /DNA_ID=CAMNT_0007437055 /DNA_START=8 /DNA_END=823 /DNA_ORIENTATION=-
MITYTCLSTLLLVYTVISLLAPLVAPPCDVVPTAHSYRARAGIEYKNVDYEKDACKFYRYAVLGGLNKWECDMCVRVIVSLVLGSIIGWERRRADRAAGIRTMAMVCLGSCVFTIDSVYAFWDGPMNWDSSRVSAAIPSGVGFLGAASIWKGTAKASDGTQIPEVHGLTTATSVWLSAAVGILAGGALYVPAVFSAFASIVYLRFAPRAPIWKPTKDDDEEEAPIQPLPSKPSGPADAGAPGDIRTTWPGARTVINLNSANADKKRPSIHV